MANKAMIDSFDPIEGAPAEVRKFISKLCENRELSLWSISERMGASRAWMYHKGDITVRKLAQVIGEIDKARQLSVEECNELLEVLGVRV